MTLRVNHLAVIVAAVVFFLWGWIWFAVFGSEWSSFVGNKPMAASPSVFILSFIMGLILAYVTAIALQDSENPNMVRHGIEFGVFFGAGIWATNLFNLGLYEQRPFGLFLIDAFYVIIGMAFIGAIIGGWRKRA